MSEREPERHVGAQPIGKLGAAIARQLEVTERIRSEAAQLEAERAAESEARADEPGT